MPKGAVPGGENGEAFVLLLSVNTSFLLNLLQRGVTERLESDFSSF